MLSRWTVGAVLILGVLFSVVSSSERVERPKGSNGRIKKIRRQNSVIRPATLNVNPSPVDYSTAPRDDDVVQYDPSGLGFEFKLPFDGRYQPIFESQHVKPYQEHNPIYQTSPSPEPTYSPPSTTPAPYFELPYVELPQVEPALPPYVPDHHVPKSNYKLETPLDISYTTANPNQYSNEYPYYCPKVGGYESQCRPAKDCAVWYDLVLITPGTACKLPDGQPGTCCPDLPHNGYGEAMKKTKKNVKCEHQCIDIYSVNAAAHAGRFNMRLMDETEKFLRDKNITIRPSSSSYTHLLFQTATEAEHLSRAALTSIETTRELGKRFELTPEEAGLGLTQFNLKDTILSDFCPADPICDEKTISSPFRTMDGSCNNLKYPSWGKSRTQFQRALVPAYADGVWLPRRTKNGSDLPSPRLVSISVVLDKNSPSEAETTWVMQYGQFLAHDLALSSNFRMSDNSGIECCTEEGKLLTDAELLHPECMPIEIPDGDPFFSKFGQRCMSFVRTIPAPRYDCSLGHGEQMNGISHYLDHSNVYGSDNKRAAALRTYENGTLKVTHQKGHYDLDLLPPDNMAETNCTLSKAVSGIDPPDNVKCFKAGDSRTNQAPNLAVTQTIFLREHNRLAAELAYLNPHWDDERLYQEARRILIAQMQHITYNEWLPIVIGRAKMQELGLLPLQQGLNENYYKNLNPSILNEFATAAFRFGHTLVQGKQDLINRRRKKESHILLRQHFNKVQKVYTPGNLEKFLIGLATQPGQDFDNYFSKEVTNHLFEEEGKGFGLDLVSLNIQRGRDHGLPGYNDYRALCGIPRAKKFSDLLDLISPAIVERFELLYDSVDDIDLYIGGVSEDKAEGALIGPTFQCIVADQFLRLKRGDRYFYDLGGQPGSFTEEQLYEIRHISFARLVCDNSFVLYTQTLIFKFESDANRIVDCDSSSIPRVDLLPWQESSSESYKRSGTVPSKKI
ncbi:peroxidase-like [Daphnia pulicaria]|uniref:peroxidase-like n=1 Tax=Daphnia pulicaria TaxID=35523 RepID=UPI001EEAC058|nr:peroxidase-like [Daphnia pulicaria]XP_046638990.1 peroxidase-like [Daphnia pulicaria]